MYAKYTEKMGKRLKGYLSNFASKLYTSVVRVDNGKYNIRLGFPRNGIFLCDSLR